MKDAFELFAEIIKTNPEVEVAYQKLKQREERRLIAYDKGYREGCNVFPIRGKRRDTIDIEEAPCNHINFDELCKIEGIISEEACDHEWKLVLISNCDIWVDGEENRCDKHFKCIICEETKSDRNVEE